MSDSKQINRDELEELAYNFHPRNLAFHKSESSENLWIRNDSPYYFMDTGQTWRLFKMIEGEAKPKKELLKSGINQQIIEELLAEINFTIE